ncbi:coenzyme F420-0:L-glutamate ligase [Ornithinimicrobium faecis]|uniref:Coenzyme F420-0:L-glutamate ligase n=1 Tax=Ornithinimicrobium faecis TaxID=2934158 RepID=A0ABY4YPQ1_9MICO|nr:MULTISPECIES: coenzyme F420-0:L-glutamate ligase [unclassified Ornithinimicrobium]USQ78736.1 coenzyme F420-0:L-glutamate ligase [Ornithinimicrobium sp. HY1793]
MTDSARRSGAVSIHPLHGIPEVTAGDDLGALIHDALVRAGLTLTEGDVLAVSSKVISKSEGLRASEDGRAEAVLAQSRRVVAERRTPAGTTRIVEALAGPVMAGAGIDGSNTGPDGALLLLPHDPDLAARQLYASLLSAHAPQPLPRFGIVVTDTAGRPWRAGQTDFALGACSVAVVEDLRGGSDSDGRELAVTTRAVADEIAAAADLVKGKSAAVPVALIRGLPDGTVTEPGAAGARSLVRTGPGDWFALGSAEAVRSALGVAPGSAAADEVGIPSALDETSAERLARAIRLALHGESPAAQVRPTEAGLVVEADDPFVAGRLCARLEVALASESLDELVVTSQPLP